MLNPATLCICLSQVKSLLFSGYRFFFWCVRYLFFVLYFVHKLVRSFSCLNGFRFVISGPSILTKRYGFCSLLKAVQWPKSVSFLCHIVYVSLATPTQYQTGWISNIAEVYADLAPHMEHRRDSHASTHLYKSNQVISNSRKVFMSVIQGLLSCSRLINNPVICNNRKVIMWNQFCSFIAVNDVNQDWCVLFVLKIIKWNQINKL